MREIAVVLDKPIPPEGRKPTAQECKRFRALGTNIRPTTSGAWILCWHGGKPYIDVLNRKSKTRCGWTFQIVEPTPLQKTPLRAPRPVIPMSNLDGVNGEPTMCW